MSITYCSIPLPNLVYASPQDRAEFDQLDLPATVHAWAPCNTLDLIKNDGQRWERRCTSKALEANGITVIFQWSEARVIQGAMPAHVGMPA